MHRIHVPLFAMCMSPLITPIVKGSLEHLVVEAIGVALHAP
jgi:hypothetical protein